MPAIDYMTRKDFEALPYRGKYDTPVICDGLVLLPMRSRHDSGFRNIDIVAVVDNEATVRLSGSSDDIEIDTLHTGVSTRIDCLPVSGLFRLWLPLDYQFRCGVHLSSIEFEVVERATK